MKRYPLLSLNLGVRGITRMSDAYQSDEALFEGFREDNKKSYGEEDETTLQNSPFAKKMQALLAKFRIDEKKASPVEV